MAFPKKAEEDRYIKVSVSLDPDLEKRFMKFCQEEERSMSWVARKSLDKWLKEQGY